MKGDKSQLSAKGTQEGHGKRERKKGGVLDNPNYTQKNRSICKGMGNNVAPDVFEKGFEEKKEGSKNKKLKRKRMIGQNWKILSSIK